MTWLARDAACLSSLLAVAQWPRMRWLSLLLLGAPCCRSGQTLQMLLPCSECWIGSVRSCPALNTLGIFLGAFAGVSWVSGFTMLQDLAEAEFRAVADVKVGA